MSETKYYACARFSLTLENHISPAIHIRFNICIQIWNLAINTHVTKCVLSMRCMSSVQSAILVIVCLFHACRPYRLSSIPLQRENSCSFVRLHLLHISILTYEYSTQSSWENSKRPGFNVHLIIMKAIRRTLRKHFIWKFHKTVILFTFLVVINLSLKWKLISNIESFNFYFWNFTHSKWLNYKYKLKNTYTKFVEM